VGLTPVNASAPVKQKAEELKKATSLAKTSTASLGKFQENLKGKLEKKSQASSGKKRKFDALVGSNEKERSLDVLNKLEAKRPTVSDQL